MLVTLNFIIPAGALYLVRTTPAVVRVVPTDLKDVSTSPVSGQQVLFSGYEFGVPWSDEFKSELCDDPPTHTVWVRFQSGLKLFVAARPRLAQAPGFEDLRRIYEVTPDKIRYWGLFQGKDWHDALLLQLKSNLLLVASDPKTESSPAETGIFAIQIKGWKGFQYGDPQKRPDTLRLRLYSNSTQVDIVLLQGAYYQPTGVTQAEINYIVQSLRNSTDQFHLAHSSN